MKKVFYLFCGWLSLIGFQSCNNDNMDNINSKNEKIKEAMSTSSSLVVSDEAENNIPKFKEALESEAFLLANSSRSYSIDEFIDDYDFSKQQKIISNQKEGIVYLVQNKINKEYFLALYENSDRIILNIKKIHIKANDNEAIVSFFKIDNTDYMTLNTSKENSIVNILSYNDHILTLATTRNGCSLAIGGAG